MPPVQHDFAAYFASFRRPRRRTDALPEGAWEALCESVDPAWGLDRQASRCVVPAAGREERVHLVPGPAHVASLFPGGGGVATLLEALSGADIRSSFRGTGRLLVVGVVPDSFTQVAIRRRDGSSIPVTVVDNVYAVEVVATTAGELPDVVRWTSDGVAGALPVPGADEEILRLHVPGEVPPPAG